MRPDGSFEFVNKAWLDTLKYTEEEVAALHLEDIISPESLKHYQAVMDSIYAGERMANLEAVFLTKNGDRVFVQGNLFPRIEAARVVATQGFYRDVTEQKEAERKYRQARARTEFLVDLMSHDLMNIQQEVLTTLEIILSSEGLPGQLRSLVQEGLQEVERAARLILNVKKMTRLESSPPAPKLVDLGEALFTAASEVEAEFPDKTLELVTKLERGQYLIMADEYLPDIFKSLLHNSMKFDPKNNVRVEVDVEPIKHTPFLKIQVKDYGPGIPDGEKEEIFAHVADRKESILGLGLGLTLVRTVLDNYGGHIRVEDRVEGDHTKGANFVILLQRDMSQGGGP